MWVQKNKNLFHNSISEECLVYDWINEKAFKDRFTHSMPCPCRSPAMPGR